MQLDDHLRAESIAAKDRVQPLEAQAGAGNHAYGRDGPGLLAERIHHDRDRPAADLDDAGAEPVGKRLGFLLQEMLREANTTGSKAADAGMLADVVVVKEELERVREQVENVE